MVGTVATTSTGDHAREHSKYSIAWTSNACGVACDTLALPSGYLRLKRFVPGAGCDAPTACYDATLCDGNCIDALSGSGANLSATVASDVKPCKECWICQGTYTLNITNAGNAKSGVIELVIQRF